MLKDLADDLTKRQQKNSTFKKHQKDKVFKENLRCRAKKYVYFEASTGNVVFETGGAIESELYLEIGSLFDKGELITAHILSV